MSDFKYLFGGMVGGVAMLAAYIIGWGIVQRCSGEEYPNPQPVPLGSLEQQYMPNSGEKVVIGDFAFIMVAESDWTRWTNAVARLEAVAERRWQNEHKTDAGRRVWHGASTNRVVSADGRTVTWYYADGFTYTEQATPSPKQSPAVRRMKKAEEPRKVPSNNMPSLLRAKREAMAARPKVKEVNAIFSPGGKVLKVEESK